MALMILAFPEAIYGVFPWGLAVGDVNEDGLVDFIASTGGSVTGPEEKAKKSPKPRKGKDGKEIVVIPELTVPRMQAWGNQGVK